MGLALKCGASVLLGWLAVMGMTMPLVASVIGAPPQELEQVWRLGAQGRFDDAAAAMPANASDEEAKFTRAVLLFNRQPRTGADIARAIERLSELTEHGTTAELRARSLYFWAGAETLRFRDAPPVAALHLYERLWRDYPGETYGQRALAQQLLLTFYTAEPRVRILARCAEIVRQAEAITDRVVRSQFHQVAARGYLQLGGEEALALEHLLKVGELGVSRREARGDLQVSIGQLATELGRPGLAREYYNEFLQEFPRDPRAYTIRARLAAISAEEQSDSDGVIGGKRPTR